MQLISPLVRALPRFTFNDFGATLVALGRSRGSVMPTFFVQIGAMDGRSYDPIYPYIHKFGWRGLLVEPLPDYAAQLRANYKDVAGMRFEQAAISDHNGTLEMQRVSRMAVDVGLVPASLGGVSTTLADRGVIGGAFLDPAVYDTIVKPHLETVTVPSLTLDALFRKHAVDEFEVMVVDVEGAEWSVLRQLDCDRHKPSLIYVEHSHMQEDEIAAALGKFGQAGYQALREEQNGENMLFIRQAA